MTRITGTSHEDQYTFMIISRSFHFRMSTVVHKICRENQNTHFMFNIKHFIAELMHTNYKILGLLK